MIFMGEEWGARTPWQFFSAFPDPALREAVRVGRTAEFAEHGWGDAAVPDPNAEQTFLDSKLDWDEPAREPHRWILHTYRDLVALRKAHPELSAPWLEDVEVEVDETARTIVLHRGALRLAVNLGGAAATLTMDAPVSGVLLASEPPKAEGRELTVAAESFAVVAL